MTDPDLIRLFIGPLEELEIPYMITGGVASVIYGDPRFTRDIDIVLELRVSDVSRLTSGFGGGDFYVPPEEVLRKEASRANGGHFNLIHRDTALRADIYLRGEDPFHAWAFDRRLRLPLDGTAIWVAPIEYVVARKLEYFESSGSDRHLRDVAMMLHISGDSVDRVELKRWIDRLGIAEAHARAVGYEC